MTVNDDTRSKYLIRLKGRVYGPYSVSQLSKLRSQGQLVSGCEVSVDGQKWDSVATVEPFLDAFATKKSRVAGEKAEPVTGRSSKSTSRSMPSVWYYSIGEDQCGPVTVIELREMIASHQLIADDLVWKEGLSDWVAISEVPELIGVIRSAGAVMSGGAPNGSATGRRFCDSCGSPIDPRAELCPACGVRPQSKPKAGKDRITAAVLAFFFGGFGIHHYYLGNAFWGTFYLLTCWSMLPAIFGFIQSIKLLCMSDEAFNKKYNRR